MRELNISLIPGDGIGPELAASARAVLGAACERFGVRMEVRECEAGDAALERTGRALPDATLEAVRRSDACLKAPVGESAADVIVALRRRLGLYANVRPAKSYPGMPALAGDIDMVVVRENTEDLYTGAEFYADGPLPIGGGFGGAVGEEGDGGAHERAGEGGTGRTAVALRIITEAASERIARYAFEAALERGGAKKVTCVHKSNVLQATDGVFAGACARVAEGYPGVEFEQMYVDACAMNLIRRPSSFDVIVTTNLFGDILSDESSQAAGGLGMAPAANVGDSFALFEPVHGAAFDIAGRGIANPSSFILSASMMLGWLARKEGGRGGGGGEECAAAGRAIEEAVRGAVAAGASTADVGGSMTMAQFTEEVASRIGRAARGRAVPAGA